MNCFSSTFSSRHLGMPGSCLSKVFSFLYIYYKDIMVFSLAGILMLTWESQSLRRTMQETVSCMMEIMRILGTILRTRWTSSSWPTWPGTGARPSSSGIGGSALSSPSCLSSWSTHLSTSYLTFQSAGKLQKVKKN